MTLSPVVPAAVDAYNAHVARDPRAAAEQAAWLDEELIHSGVTFAGVAMPAFLRPHFVARDHWTLLRERGRRVLEIADRAARTAFDGDVHRLCDFLGTPEAEARWVRLDPGRPDVVLSRLDAFLTPQGPRFIEINSDAPAGFGYSDRMAEVFRRLPLFQEFARTHPVAYEPSAAQLVKATLAQSPVPHPTVGIVDWREVKTRADQEILRDTFIAAGVRCVLADPRDLHLRGGRLVSPQGLIDIVYRRGVLTELAPRADEMPDFFRAYAEGHAVFVNTFRCRLGEDKAFFAVLTDETYASLFTEEERALLLATLPWTRKVEERKTIKDGVEIDLVAWAITHRESLVLKPAHGYGGDSVYVGTETSASEWEAAITRAIHAPWVIQERVVIPEEPFPVLEGGALRFDLLKVNVNPFYAAGADVGAVTRCSRSSVINVSAGGGSLPCFVVG